jgi:hypothetical protein
MEVYRYIRINIKNSFLTMSLTFEVDNWYLNRALYLYLVNKKPYLKK